MVNLFQLKQINFIKKFPFFYYIFSRLILFSLQGNTNRACIFLSAYVHVSNVWIDQSFEKIQLNKETAEFADNYCVCMLPLTLRELNLKGLI